MAVKDAVLEDEIYLRVNRDNPASLKVMLNNGGYIHHQDETKIYVRIRKYDDLLFKKISENEQEK